MKRAICYAAFACMLTSTTALAQNAVVTADVNMRAGPGTRFPVVTTIPEDRGVTIHGCIRGRDWCDVSWRGERGWVFSEYIEYLANGRRIIVPEAPARLAPPIVTFSFDTYWDRHYRGDPWYDRRDRWRDGWRDGWRDRWDDGRRGRGEWDGRDGRRWDRDDDRRGGRGDRDDDRRGRGGDRDESRGDRGGDRDERAREGRGRDMDGRGVREDRGEGRGG